MRAQRVTGKQLANHCGVSPAAASNWTATGVPYMRANDVANFLDISVDQITAATGSAIAGTQGGNALLTVTVDDKSMLPSICVGDTLEIDPGQVDVAPGDLVAAEVGDTVIIRRLDLGTGTPRLIADNGAYPPLVDFEIVGRVTSVTHVFD